MDKDRIVKTADINAPRARVWAALTDYKAFGKWFHVALDQPFTAGGWSTGKITFPGHEEVVWRALVGRLEPENHFSFYWPYSEDPYSEAPKDAPVLLTEFTLADAGARTRLTITESGFSVLPEPLRSDMMANNLDGWTIQTENLANYLAD